MKKIIIALLFCVSGSMTFAAGKIQRERINKHKKNIDRTFTMIRYGKIGVSAVSLAAFSYVTWQVGKDFFGFNKKGEKQLGSDSYATKAELQAVASLLAKQKNNSKVLNQSFLKKSVIWLKNSSIGVGTFVAQGVVGSVCLGKFNGYLEKFFGDHNLHWFLQEKTYFNQTKKMLQQNISDLIALCKSEKTKDSAYKKKIRKTAAFVKENCSDLLLQAEQVVAFMEYSIERLDNNNIHVNDSDRLLPAYLITQTNNFVESFDEIVNNIYEQKYQNIESTYIEYIKSLDQIMSQFNFLEARSEWFLNV